ncbi:MAG: succinylglutamate desuccinylase/aspartoacylase family protein [Thermomicrobiales bacterium]|nr:succinylglutamate desuccinylase/aspartoacylase family protein [Thermomicrobiales bacterium]
MNAPSVTSSIDLSAPGKQIGRLRYPRISNNGGWAYDLIPIACITNGEGPTVLVTGGNHGNEYEGQIAALRLIDEIEAADVTGRIIIIPVISVEAAWAFTRLWPSGVNFNRSFPGRPDGPPAEQIADYFTRVLFPMADVVIDMHSGGNAFFFLPCSHMHVVDNPAQRKAMLEGMLAWNSDYHFLYIDVNGTGLLPVEAEDQGKTVITTELGGGGRVPAYVHQLAWSGLTNVLRHEGVLKGALQTRESLGKAPAIILDGRDPENYVNTDEPGFWENLLEPGDAVQKGDPVGRLWFPATPERAPRVFTAPLDGILTVIRATTPTLAGDSVFVTGQPIEAEAVLNGE